MQLTGLWLTAPLATLLSRIASRHGDASDATGEVVHWQQRTLQPPDSTERQWIAVDTGEGRAAALARARACLAVL